MFNVMGGYDRIHRASKLMYFSDERFCRNDNILIRKNRQGLVVIAYVEADVVDVWPLTLHSVWAVVSTSHVKKPGTWSKRKDECAKSMTRYSGRDLVSDISDTQTQLPAKFI